MNMFAIAKLASLTYFSEVNISHYIQWATDYNKCRFEMGFLRVTANSKRLFESFDRELKNNLLKR